MYDLLETYVEDIIISLCGIGGGGGDDEVHIVDAHFLKCEKVLGLVEVRIKEQEA